MYTNIGAKLQVLAQLIAWIGIGASALIGFMMIVSGLGQGFLGQSLVAMGIGIFIGGSASFWISSFFICGFSELIVKTTDIANNIATRAYPSLAEANTANDAIMVKLNTLISWKDSGMISGEEFQTKMQELLRGE